MQSTSTSCGSDLTQQVNDLQDDVRIMKVEVELFEEVRARQTEALKCRCIRFLRLKQGLNHAITTMDRVVKHYKKKKKTR